MTRLTSECTYSGRGELLRMASAMLRRERIGHTLGASDLLQEAELRLGMPPIDDLNRGLIAAYGRAFRQILIDHARKRTRIKHGGDRTRVPWDSAEVVCQPASESSCSEFEILAVHDALKWLSTFAPTEAEVADRRFFQGMSVREIADQMGRSVSYIEKKWTMARALLMDRLGCREVVADPYFPG